MMALESESPNTLSDYLKSVDHKKKSSFDVHCTTREHGRGPTHLNAYLENENNKIFVRVESAEVCAMQ